MTFARTVLLLFLLTIHFAKSKNLSYDYNFLYVCVCVCRFYPDSRGTYSDVIDRFSFAELQYDKST